MEKKNPFLPFGTGSNKVFSLSAITSKIPTILLVTAGMGESLKGRQLHKYTHHFFKGSSLSQMV